MHNCKQIRPARRKGSLFHGGTNLTRKRMRILLKKRTTQSAELPLSIPGPWPDSCLAVQHDLDMKIMIVLKGSGAYHTKDACIHRGVNQACVLSCAISKESNATETLVNSTPIYRTGSGVFSGTSPREIRFVSHIFLSNCMDDEGYIGDGDGVGRGKPGDSVVERSASSMQSGSSGQNRTRSKFILVRVSMQSSSSTADFDEPS